MEQNQKHMKKTNSYKETAKNVKSFYNATTGQNLAVNHKGIELLVSLLMAEKNYRRYTNYTTGRGRFTSAMISMIDDYTLVLTSLGLEFTTGNDSPRGGRNGDYILLTDESYNKLTEMFEKF